MFDRRSHTSPSNDSDSHHSASDSDSDTGGDDSDGNVPEKSKGRRCRCTSVLTVHVDSFRSMKRQGGELKKRCHYTPKGDREACLRDVKQQNVWLLPNVFDASGNYLNCRSCVESVLGVSKQRLATLRKLKLGVKPLNHGLAAKSSNRSVPEVKQQFLEFVDYSRSLTGRRLGSSSARYYFDAVYTSFRAPDKKDENYDAKMKRSVVGCFNQAQKLSAFRAVPTLQHSSG